MQNGRTTPAHLIGMLTPSSNTVLEPYTTLLLEPLFPAVTAHFGRFRVRRIALDDGANNQFAPEPVLAAAELLADAKMDVMAWNGTSAAWLGFQTDEILCAAVEERTGVPATSAILSLNRLLAENGITRLGLVSPYTLDVEDKIVANYAAIGVSTVARQRCDLADNFSFATVPEARIEAMCEEVAEAKPEAIAIVCTNMRGTFIAPEIERRLGIPVYDSVSFTLWGAMRLAGLPTGALTRFGALFQDAPAAAAPSPVPGEARP